MEKNAENLLKKANVKRKFKTAEREKERTKGDERKEYKIKITRVKKEGNFPANIYTSSKYNCKM